MTLGERAVPKLGMSQEYQIDRRQTSGILRAENVVFMNIADLKG